jgi:hypothetical protein
MGTPNTTLLPSFLVPQAVDVYPKQPGAANSGVESNDLWFRGFLARFKNFPNSMTGPRPAVPELWHIHRESVAAVGPTGTTTPGDYTIWDGAAWVDVTFDAMCKAIFDLGLTALGTYKFTGNKLGVGTTTPRVPLQVGTGTSYQVAYTGMEVWAASSVNDGVGNVNVYSTDATAIDKGGSLCFGSANPTLAPFARAKIAGRDENGTNYAGYMQFLTTTSGGSVTEKMRLTSNGNLGIGTMTPTATLHVSGTIRFGVYTVATVPSASASGVGTQIYVSDSAGGSNTYVSDGTNWRNAARTILA